MAKTILVYADWLGLDGHRLLGRLHVSAARGGSERFEFEYDSTALADPELLIQLDPRIGLYTGRQHPPQGVTSFGVFSDASPDRWGQMLMKRRHEREVRTGNKPAGSSLHASDFLIGVHDRFRVGAIRLKTDEKEPFLDNQDNVAAPPFAMLRELEDASRRFESGENLDAGGKDWLRMLIAPGGSLGGARPKASVMDTDGSLWIAKFPSINDDFDVGAWELVTNALARMCGLRVAIGKASKFASDYHCFMVQRFDRTPDGQRLHFASAMTLTENTDGADHSTGASYLDLAEVIIRQGSEATEDLRELWRRIVFSMLVSNTDDHLRNHGFILEPSKGWRLSAAYDMNPAPYSDGLKLNVSEVDNALDLDLALSVAAKFRYPMAEAIEVIEGMTSIVAGKWRMAAAALGVSRSDIERMAPAFDLANG